MLNYLEQNYTENGVVLPHARILDSDGDVGRTPVANESFATSVEDRRTADGLDTSLIYLQAKHVTMISQKDLVRQTYQLVVQRTIATNRRSVRSLVLK